MFFGNDTPAQSHKDVLSFLASVVEIRFSSSIKYQLDALCSKYKELLLKNHNASLNELKEICSSETKHIIKLISKDYLDEQISYYFSKDGLIEIIYSMLVSECKNYIINKIENLRIKTTP